MRLIDLRSDTVTKPTPEMREAMAAAEVGDDGFGEDPTTNLLQDRVAALLGAEAALFVPSGSMGNLVALRSMAQPGDEVICHEDAHLLHYEVGSLAAVAGISTRPLAANQAGGAVLDPQEVERAIRPPGQSFPRTKVIALENTNNLAGGAVYPVDDMRDIRKIAAEHGLLVYLDGARIFNASVATGVPVPEYFALIDAMSFCFSKGLACPVGSIVAGRSQFIQAARRYRKMHGGGMRQVGVLAAPCLVALDSMIDRLADDHANARRLAEGIAGLRPGAVDPERVETNIVLVRTQPLGYEPEELVDTMAAREVHFFAYRQGVVRMVTHKDVSADDIEYVLEQLAEVVA